MDICFSTVTVQNAMYKSLCSHFWDFKSFSCCFLNRKAIWKWRKAFSIPKQWPRVLAPRNIIKYPWSTGTGSQSPWTWHMLKDPLCRCASILFIIRVTLGKMREDGFIFGISCTVAQEQSMGFGVRPIWIFTLAPPLISWGILGNYFNPLNLNFFRDNRWNCHTYFAISFVLTKIWSM